MRAAALDEAAGRAPLRFLAQQLKVHHSAADEAGERGEVPLSKPPSGQGEMVTMSNNFDIIGPPAPISPTQEDIELLYLDDDPMLCKAFERAARAQGLNITTASNPVEASALIKAKNFHVIAVDYRMPQMTGVSFLELHREALKDTYKLMVTGMCDFETVHAAINRAGVHRYVTKPWQRDELISAIHDASRHARLLIENRQLQRQLQLQNRELAAMNAGLHRLARERTLDVLNALVAALDYRDTETQWHSRRVALFARMIATQMGITGDQLQDIEVGAMLHDVGKIGISDTILLQPGKLTDEEWIEMKKHPELGFRLLAGIDFLDTARYIVLHHHERWDGGGYPHQLAGENICIGARIFALCDTLDAMTSDRPYRRGRPFHVALEEIVSQAGTQFDPTIVAAFCQIPQERWRQVIAFGHAQEHGVRGDALGWAAHEYDLLPELKETFTWLSALRQSSAL